MQIIYIYDYTIISLNNPYMLLKSNYYEKCAQNQEIDRAMNKTR